MDNLKEMDRFLEKFNLLRLNQEEIEIMNNLITSTEIEAVINNLPPNKSPGLDGFTEDLCKTFREKQMPRNLYAGQEATVRTGHGTTDWFQIGKEVCQGCILSPCLFNLYAEYIMKNAGLEEAQAGIRLPGEISITSDMQMTPPLWQKVKKN